MEIMQLKQLKMEDMEFRAFFHGKKAIKNQNTLKKLCYWGLFWYSA